MWKYVSLKSMDVTHSLVWREVHYFRWFHNEFLQGSEIQYKSTPIIGLWYQEKSDQEGKSVVFCEDSIDLKSPPPPRLLYFLYWCNLATTSRSGAAYGIVVTFWLKLDWPEQITFLHMKPYSIVTYAMTDPSWWRGVAGKLAPLADETGCLKKAWWISHRGDRIPSCEKLR